MIPVSAMGRNDIETSFGGDCRMTKNCLLVAEGISEKNFHFFFTVTETTDAKSSNLTLVTDLKLWPKRLGHVEPNGIHKIVWHEAVEGMNLGI